MSLKHHQYGQNAINLELWQGPHLPNVLFLFLFCCLIISQGWHSEKIIKRLKKNFQNCYQPYNLQQGICVLQPSESSSEKWTFLLSSFKMLNFLHLLFPNYIIYFFYIDYLNHFYIQDNILNLTYISSTIIKRTINIKAPSKGRHFCYSL